jgi:hypothetical protein
MRLILGLFWVLFVAITSATARAEMNPTARAEMNPTARAEMNPTVRAEMNPAARAEMNPAARAPSGGGDDRVDPLTVELLTMGPGEHPFFKFGHNAIRIRDRRDHSDRVYNFGTFSFESPTLIADFFKGRLNYWLSVESFAMTVLHYREEHRSLVAQRLALSPDAKRELKRALDTNALPENRLYKYDYFFDNCSTRIRDAIDRATQGQLRATLRARATRTLRDHALRATSDYFLEYLVLSIGLGPLVDRPVDQWAEAFLPEMLTDGLRHTVLRAPDGTTFPLVQAERTVLAHHDTRPAEPPHWGWLFLTAGVCTGVLFFVFRLLSGENKAFSFGFSLLLGLFGTLIGLLGFALLSLWVFTDHAVAFRNQNLLLLSPFALLLPVHVVRGGFKNARSRRGLRTLSLVLCGCAVLASVIKVLPLEQQQNSYLIAFFLPCWFGLFAASRDWRQKET